MTWSPNFERYDAIRGFASAALTGLLARKHCDGFEATAALAFEFAEAMADESDRRFNRDRDAAAALEAKK